MGYWGTDIFQSDYALDTLTELVAPFVNFIEANAENPSLCHWDDVVIDEFVIGAKILICLMDNGFPIECLPPSKPLRVRRNEFAIHWLEYAKGSDFHIERLSHILVVWDRLIEIAAQKEADKS